MGLLLTSGENTTDPTTGIPVILGVYVVTQDNQYVSTQATGEPPGGLNQLPGTDPVASGIGNNDPGLPYGFSEVPATGPLT